MRSARKLRDWWGWTGGDGQRGRETGGDEQRGRETGGDGLVGMDRGRERGRGRQNELQFHVHSIDLQPIR